MNFYNKYTQTGSIQLNLCSSIPLKRIIWTMMNFKFSNATKGDKGRGESIWCKKWICLEILHRYSNAVFYLDPTQRRDRALNSGHRRVHQTRILFSVKKNDAMWSSCAGDQNLKSCGVAHFRTADIPIFGLIQRIHSMIFFKRDIWASSRNIGNKKVKSIKNGGRFPPKG